MAKLRTTREKNRNVKLPEMLCCYRCNKNKSPQNFSSGQLGKAREALAKLQGKPFPVVFDASQPPYLIYCQKCNTTYTYEYYCVDCEAWYSPDYFSKTQRKDSENARCLACVKKTVDMEPVNYNDWQVDENESINDDESVDSDRTHRAPASSTCSASTDGPDGGVSLVGLMSDVSFDESSSVISDSTTASESHKSGHAPALSDKTKFQNKAGKKLWGPASELSGKSADSAKPTPFLPPHLRGKDTAKPHNTSINENGSEWATVSRRGSGKRSRGGGFSPRGMGQRSWSSASSATGSEISANSSVSQLPFRTENRKFAKVKAYKPPREPEQRDEKPTCSDDDDSDDSDY